MQWAFFSDCLFSLSAVSSRHISSMVCQHVHSFHSWIIFHPISKSPLTALWIPRWTLTCVALALGCWNGTVIDVAVCSSSPWCLFISRGHTQKWNCWVTWSLIIWLPEERPGCCRATCHSRVPSAVHRGANFSTSGPHLFFSILKAKLCQGLWTAYSLCSECVSFVMNSVEHLYVSSLTIWMSSLAKHLFSPLPICKLWFLYGSRLNIFFACMCLLYVRAHVCWSQRTTCRRGFSPSTRGVLEVKLRWSGLGASAWWVISPAPGSRFSNVSWARVSVVRFANLFSWNVCCLFIPVFLVLALRFRFLIHLELIFINGMR